MKKYFLTYFMLLWHMILWGVPARQIAWKHKQSDGTILTVILYGDEFSHSFMTNDSIPIYKTDKGFFYTFVEKGGIRVSNVLAHDVGQRSIVELPFVQAKNEVKQILIQKHTQRLLESSSFDNVEVTRTSNMAQRQKYVGSKKGLVILVNFANLEMTSNSAHRDFDNLFNLQGYSENNSVGSVHDYFYDQSYGKFDLKFDVVGPVTLSYNYGYYGANSEINGTDQNVREMVLEACHLVDEQVNFKDYDWDGDGEVEQVFLIYAGYGEHAGAPANTIWPHKSILGSNAITLDGVKINTYACSCELNGMSGTKMCGIGTPCHEFSHCLGLPDLYDTDYSGAFGMSYWDVMNSGSHSGPTNNGEVPYGYSAYERWFAGWLEPKEITSTQHIDALANVEDTPDAYIIYNQGNRNECYILENHQASKWFQYVRSYRDMHGLMITHVDYDQKAWATNTVNPDLKHQRMSIVPADNSYGETEKELRGDLFPGSNGIQWLTNDSHINVGGKMFNENIDGTYYMNRTIGNIEENIDGTISFDVVLSEEIPIPRIKEITEINSLGYTVSWEEIPNADSYIIEQTSYKLGTNMIPILKRQMVSNIRETSLQMTWLTDGKTQVRMKAIVNGFESNWSSLVDVPHEASGIGVVIDDSYKESMYYNISGIRLEGLQQGINIVRQGNQVRKVFKNN